MKILTRNLALSATSLSMAWIVGQAQNFTPIYSTGFDTSQGYAAGNVDGQNGWDTYQPSSTVGFASVTMSAPAGFTGTGALSLTSGTSASTSPRSAWPPSYESTFSAQVTAGATQHVSQVSMYLPSGSTSTARLGLVTYATQNNKILGGFFVQANTGTMYMIGYYNNAGTLNNFTFNTNAQFGYDTWNTVTTTWSPTTGRFELFWGAYGFYVDGAAAGSIAKETDFYATRNNSSTAATAYFDNLRIGTYSPVPEPSTYAALSALGLVGFGLWRRARR